MVIFKMNNVRNAIKLIWILFQANRIGATVASLWQQRTGPQENWQIARHWTIFIRRLMLFLSMLLDT